MILDPLLEGCNALVREEEAAERSQRPGRIHLSAPLEDVTVAVVIVTRRSGLGVSVRDVVRGAVPLEGGPSARIITKKSFFSPLERDFRCFFPSLSFTGMAGRPRATCSTARRPSWAGRWGLGDTGRTGARRRCRSIPYTPAK